MARWRLAAPHYLSVPGTKWEYQETDRTTGRPTRTQFAVPTLLDPSQASDWNYKYNQDEGEIIVCLDGKGEPKDIVFVGEPTPDMVPLDDEAKAISAKMALKWKHPIETLTGPFADRLLDDLQKQVAEVRSTPSSTKIEGMEELLAAIVQMTKQNQALVESVLASKAEASAPSPATRRA